MKKKIAIYSDSSIVGGHEILTIQIANNLREHFEIHFFYYADQVGNALDFGVIGHKINVRTRTPFSGLRGLNPWSIKEIEDEFSKVQPQAVVIAQGMIEHGIPALIAAKNLRIKCSSYIPLCFSLRDTRAVLGSARDLLNRMIYRRFDSFITISEEQRELLEYWTNGTKPIYLLRNVVDCQNQTSEKKKDKPFNLKIGIVGRVQFSQKGQDKSIEIAKALLERGLRDFKIVVIGDGPDLGKLKELAEKANLAAYFEFTGWVKEKSRIYGDVDLLISTSLYEGVPLVMLEALARGIPFFASRSGIFEEYLPDLFLADNAKQWADLITDFEMFPDKYTVFLPELKRYTASAHSAQRFYLDALEILNSVIAGP